ncbi:aspartate--tRNA ligase [Marispirochaeta aestuarii]|uniref:aspartate--tRNA ligase n=1 Tax=Marispirochaeta aestuarii TaxID=1963862 RepID=UPI0029C8E0F5|nr:aspartate--tRNA ligase [Marispirochaeta aestuarii]
MEHYKRTATCGQLSAADEGATVTLNGWVHRRRDHGGVQFIDLRDRYGLTQIVVDEDAAGEVKETAAELKFEYCIAVVGTVRSRLNPNPNIPTGEIELKAEKIQILSRCEVLPFMIDEKSDAKEDLRLKFRYLDLRSFSMQRKIRLRHDVTFAVREFLNGEGFLEIETPTLIKSTPEGARDFIVPSRLHPGKVYALPQSPQLFKQILMVGGCDRYFQIARCYRDEDARGDRQLEFTQIDLEMSYVSKDDVFAVTEGMMAHIFKKTMNIDLPRPFPRLPYFEALDRFGSDKPELRFGMELQDFASFVSGSGFKVFEGVLESGGVIKALVAPGCAEYSRKQIAELEETAKTYGAKGLAWMKVSDSGELDGGIAKFFTPRAQEILSSLEAGAGDLILCVADERHTACTSLGAVRLRLGRNLELIPEGTFNFCWIIDFPLFEWNSDEEKWDPAHHMFTMPQAQYLDTLEKNPGDVRADMYDLVCNGFELASGSIRVHDPEIQKRIFQIVGFSEEEAQNRFGFLLDAFRYGPPPHGGIAPGLDRLVMIMAGENSIREVIAFPKNTVGISPMDESPSPAEPDQYRELHLAAVPVREKE